MSNNARESKIVKFRIPDSLSVTAWMSLLLFAVSQARWSERWESNVWQLISVVSLVSCAGLSELRRRRTEHEVVALREAATTDPLTGVGNRRWLDSELKRRLAQFRRQGAPVSVLMIDVDHFKRINDAWGHEAGDVALRALAKSVGTTLRDMDVLTRFGGEEFLAVLPGTHVQQAAIVAERIRRAVQEMTVPFSNHSIKLTVSIGVASAANLDDEATILKRADEAMYVAKKHGRNGCYVKTHDESACAKAADELQLAPL